MVVVALLSLVGRSGRQGPALPPPYAAALKLTDMKMSAAENFVGATVTYLDGKITNTRDKTVTHAAVQATFKNSLGQIVQKETLPINVLTTGGPYPDVVDLSTAPLAPGQARPFRITVEGTISADWNRELPDLQFVQVMTR